jgi:hypothetical protein
MSRFAGISLIVGAVCGMASICLLFAPATSRSTLAKLPRSKFAGAVLACIALSWVTVLLMQTHIGFLEKYKPFLMVLAPALLILVVLFMDELLAPRALGGLFLLIPAPILVLARWHDSSWRYFAIVSSYVMVIKGITLILNPYLFGRWQRFAMRTDASARVSGGLGLIYALIWISLAFFVY